MKIGEITKAGFNSATIPWTAPDMSGFNASSVPDYAADPTDIETYRRDGVVILRGASPDWVETLRAGLARNLASPDDFRFPCDSLPEGTPGRFFDSYCNWDLIPEYRDFALNSCAAAMAGQFMQSSRSQLFHEHAFLKEPGTQAATPWHQDLPYYCMDGDQTASVYVALDHADADVAVRFVKGSHKSGKLFLPRVFMDGASFNEEDDTMQAVPDIDGNAETYDILAGALEPGDTIVFNFRTLHGTTDAPLNAMRRAFSTRWMGDDVTYCVRAGETSPPFPGINLNHGDAMREDWFPVIWSRT
jgi:ectoine hydroxylase-related dioxygenase (phytanoyl-CoA dioxygenase family)